VVVTATATHCNTLQTTRCKVKVVVTASAVGYVTEFDSQDFFPRDSQDPLVLDSHLILKILWIVSFIGLFCKTDM